MYLFLLLFRTHYCSNFILSLSQACSSLSERLEQCQCDLDEASQTIEELKTTLAKQDMNIEQSKHTCIVKIFSVQSSLIRVYTVCHFILSAFLAHYCGNTTLPTYFRIIVTFFSGVHFVFKNLRILNCSTNLVTFCSVLDTPNVQKAGLESFHCHFRYK